MAHYENISPLSGRDLDNPSSFAVKVELGDPRYCQRSDWHDAHLFSYELEDGTKGHYECHGAPWPGP